VVRDRGPAHAASALTSAALLLCLLAVPGPAEAAPDGLRDAPVDGPTLDQAFQPRRIALVVGVDQYDDDAFPGLRFASRDARAMAEILDDPMWGGFDDVVVLSTHARTSRVEILAAIDELTATLQRNDTFLFYFSGHGTLSTQDSGQTSLYLCARDTDADRPASTAIAVDTLQRIFKTRVPCRRKVMILDSCHNGEAKSFVTARTEEELSQRRSPLDPMILTRVGEAEAHLFAAAFHQPALEDPALKHGVYTYYLMQSLSRRSDDADLDGNRVVSVVEAHQFARDRTIAHTSGAQVPQAMFKEIGREDINLSGGDDALEAAERGLLTSYSRLLANCHIRVDGIPRGMLPKALPVEPGIHQVEVVEPSSGQVLVQRSVRVGAGQSLSVDALADERRAEGRTSFAAGATFFGVVGPYAQSYPAFSAGPDLSMRWRFGGVGRNVRLSVDLAAAHGEGRYQAAYDLPITADMIRVGGSIQACADIQRASLWIGPRIHLVGLSLRHADIDGEAQHALMPSGGLTAGLDIWSKGRIGVQLAAYADVFSPVVRDRLDSPEPRFGVLVGGQIRILGSLR
jgi:hypothetical protein